MHKVGIIAAVAVMVPSTANATRWVLVAQTPGLTRYIDTDAIVVEDSTATLWLRSEYANRGASGEKRTVEKWMHDCAKARAKVLALTLYKPNGSVIGSAELPRYRLDWSPIIPGSASAVIHERVCAVVDGTYEERGETKQVAARPRMASTKTVTGAIYLKSGAVKIPAKTRSGYCLKTPPRYLGTGSIDYPSITGTLPRCLDDTGLVAQRKDGPLRK